jgi:hypothetical protein
LEDLDITGNVQGVFNKLDAFMALRFTVTGAPPSTKHVQILPMAQHADYIWNEGKFYLCSQITGDVENAVPLHIDIPRTGKRVIYLSQLIVSLKTQVQQSLLPMKHTRHKLSLMEQGVMG